jgi:hypothetical protein
VEQIASRVALLREGRVAAVDALSVVRAQSRRRGRARPVNRADVPALADALTRVPRVSDVPSTATRWHSPARARWTRR